MASALKSIRRPNTLCTSVGVENCGLKALPHEEVVDEVDEGVIVVRGHRQLNPCCVGFN
ncbi:hypothetical protein QJS10_CPA10g00692 [Acorus calamus]|uniref:Uncharacterized protein n=1 Tax=Acorus calamus TaxID=4465 RepID=A0AAV9E057_ACOCL|nr:hypothetical protein QJS10_CPA10g00692 [Acorus calamus]